MNIKELRARLAQVLASYKATLVKLDDDELTAEERTKLEAEADGFKADYDATTKKLARALEVQEMEADVAAQARGQGRQTRADTDPPRAGALDTTTDLSEGDPWRGFAQDRAGFFLSVRRAGMPGAGLDERLKPLAGPSTYDAETGSTDGYMVPPAIRDEIWEAVTEDGSEIMNLMTAEPTEGNQVQVIKDETTPWGSSGVQAAWAAEGIQLNASKLASKLTDVKLHKLYAFVLATDELLEDAPRLYDRLTRQSARAIGWKGSEAIMWGTGVGQPLGWMESNPLITVDADSGQTLAAKPITVGNLGNMLSRLTSGSLGRSVWVANSDLIPALLTLVLGQRPLFIPDSGTLNDAPNFGTLLGRPVVFSEHAQQLGTVGDISLIDPMGYYLTNKKSGVNFAQSIHLYFDYGIQAFRWTVRLGGQPYLSAAIARAKSANTKSHFVTLAART